MANLLNENFLGHGVFRFPAHVNSSLSSSGKARLVKDCAEVAQKPSVIQMRERSMVVEDKYAYTDSAYWINAAFVCLLDCHFHPQEHIRPEKEAEAEESSRENSQSSTQSSYSSKSCSDDCNAKYMTLNPLNEFSTDGEINLTP